MLLLLLGLTIPDSAGLLIFVFCVWVDWTPRGIFFICPFAVAMDSGRCCLIALDVNPGHVLKCLLFTAFIQVAFGGENAHWCIS